MNEYPLASAYLALCERSARLTAQMLSEVSPASLRYAERQRLKRTVDRLHANLQAARERLDGQHGMA